MSIIQNGQNTKKRGNEIISNSNFDNNININEKTKINENESNIEYNRDEEIKIKINNDNLNKNNNNKYLLYGNNIRNLKPKYLGKTRAFCYYKNYPLIIIGPDCKIF